MICRKAVLLFVFRCSVSLWIGAASFASGQGTVPQKAPAGSTSKTVIDLNTEELRAAYPGEFGHFAFADNQQELARLLKKVGENVEAFFRNIPNTSSKEQIFLQRLRLGRVQASAGSEFSYLLLVPSDHEEIIFKEDRVDSKGHAIELTDRNRAPSAELERLSQFVLTAGFAGCQFFLHPSHQSGSLFRYLGRQTSGARFQVMAFAQKQEAGDFLTAIHGSQDLTPVLLQGLIWVDPLTSQIVRMRTDLLEPDSKDGVKRQATEVWFSEIHFTAMAQSFWLPRRVVVTTERGQDTFRNEHGYSDYRLFTVESSSKVTLPQIKK
ncbi:MAG: hypothetical protein ABSH28_10090 [Acidobacteriota bacterium]